MLFEIADEQMLYYSMKHNAEVLKDLTKRLPLQSEDRSLLHYILDNYGYFPRPSEQLNQGIMPVSLLPVTETRFKGLAMTHFLLRFEVPQPHMHDYYFISPLIALFDPNNPHKKEYLDQKEILKNVFRNHTW